MTLALMKIRGNIYVNRDNREKRFKLISNHPDSLRDSGQVRIQQRPENQQLCGDVDALSLYCDDARSYQPL